MVIEERAIPQAKEESIHHVFFGTTSQLQPKAWLNDQLKPFAEQIAQQLLPMNRPSVALNQPAPAKEEQEQLSKSETVTGSVKFNTSAATAVDQFLSTLLTRLTVTANETAAKLESLTGDVCSRLPRTMADLDTLRQDCLALKQKVSAAEKSVSAVEEETEEAFEGLVRLDTIKTRMEKALASLKEADKWNTLESDTEAIFDSGDYLKMAIRLHDAQSSLHMLQNAPDINEKTMLLEKLRYKLEATMNPLLLKALQEQNFESVKNSYVIYAKIDCVDQFMTFYVNSRKAQIQKLWNELDHLHTEKLDNIDAFPNALRRFYEEAYLVLNREFNWGGHMFQDPVQKALKLIQQIFLSLNPSLDSRFATISIKQKDSTILVLVASFHSTETFLRSLEKMLGLNAEPVTKRIRQTSEWAQCILSPYTSYHQIYDQFAQKWIMSQIHPLLRIPLQQVGWMESVRLMTEAMPRIMLFLSQAVDQCQSFTHGYGILHLSRSINSVLLETFRILQTVLREMQTMTKMQRSTTATPSTGPLDAHDPLDEISTSNMIHSAEDWSNFQSGLRLLTSEYNMLIRLSEWAGRTQERCGLDWTRFQKALAYSTNDELNGEFSEMSEEESVKAFGCRASLAYLEKVMEKQAVVSAYQSLERGSFSLVTQDSLSSFKQLARTSQKAVFQTLFVPIQRLLCDVNKMNVWKAEEDMSRPRMAFHGLDVPSFSLSPGSYIHRVGEHLLTMPQQLEVYITQSSSANSRSDEDTTSCVAADALQFWLPWIIDALASTPDLPDDRRPLPFAATLTDRQPVDSFVIAHEWLSALAYRTVSYFLYDQILKIPRDSMTVHGARQLLTDLEYLMNVLLALGVIDDMNGDAGDNTEEYEQDGHGEGVVAEQWKVLANHVHVVQTVLTWLTHDTRDVALERLKAVWQGLGQDGSESTVPAVQKLAAHVVDNDAKRVLQMSVQLMKGVRIEV